MKITTLLLLITAVSLSSCFDGPEYAKSPNIKFNSIEFKRGTANIKDSLIIDIHFEDGDSDLGLDDNYTATDSKFRQGDFFVDSANNIVTIKHQQALDLPPFEYPYICTNYRLTPTFSSFCSEAGISNENCDQTIKSLGVEVLENQSSKIILDTLYFEPNENFYNYFLEFYVKNDQGEFEKYNWYDNELIPDPCAVTSLLNLRFPVVSDDEKNSPVEGDLKYALVSRGLWVAFQNETLKIKIWIKDRALNQSNVVETGTFTLQSIQTN